MYRETIDPRTVRDEPLEITFGKAPDRESAAAAPEGNASPRAGRPPRSARGLANPSDTPGA